MSNTSSIFALFAFLVGVMLFGIWSNIHAYAQQSSSSPTLSAASPPTGNSVSKSISPELKAQMCDPTNPNLKVVNTTEAHICGIPKTVKPPLASAAATPKTSTVTSLIQQAPTRKPASANITALKQQQIKAVNNTHVNGISRPADGAAGTTISQVTRPPTNTSSPSSLAIAPQINAVNQEQQAPLIPITRINGTTGTNGTAGQNHTFQATSPVAASGKLLYLGYHDTAATSSSSSAHGNSGSKDKSSQTNKPPTHSSSSSSTNDSSPPKKVKRSSSSSSGTESSTPPHSSIIVTYNNNSPQTTKTTSTAKLTKTHSSSDNTSPKTDKSSTATDSGFTGKKKSTRTSTTNSDLTPYYTGDSGSTRKKHSHLDLTPSVTSDNSPPKKVKRSSSSSSDSRPSIHSNTNNDGIESSASSASSASDLGSAIRDKVDSIIRNSLGEVKHSLFGFSDNGGF